MSKQLRINEKYSKHWPMIALISAILSILFFISFHVVGSVLLEGYLRLTAFALFALALLSLLKIRDGQVEISIDIAEENTALITYKVRDNVISEEEFGLQELQNLKIDQMPDKSIYNNFMKSDKCIRFRRKDTADWLYLNQVNGRVIPLSRKNADKIIHFFKENVTGFHLQEDLDHQ